MPIGPSRPLNLAKPESIDIRQAARYFGARGEADSATLTLLEKCAAPLLAAATPRAVWLEADVESLTQAGILKGEDIFRHLEGCSEAIASISKAVELISDITAQTNLLSLNASIEAARAGQAGKGFAVVATEIKQLAEQSSQSADTIKKIADDILEKSNKSVELTERMRALAEKEQADIGGAKNGFDALSQIIEANVTTAGIIAEKTKNLEELKQTIINSITELSAISEENAASNEEVTANVSDIAEAVNKISDDTGTIKKVSTDLKELMQYFK